MISIIEPDNVKHFVALAKVYITVDSYDPYSIMSKEEYFIGSTKIGES